MGQPSEDERHRPTGDDAAEVAPASGAAAQDDGAAPETPVRQRPARRTLVIGLIAAVVALAAAGGVGAYATLRKPDGPTAIIDAYLRAMRDGDVERAASLWTDAPNEREGAASPRQRVHPYLRQHRDAYIKALSGHGWHLSQFEARLGTGVDVTLDAIKLTYLLIGSDDDGWKIMLGPEDALGRPDPEGNPLLTPA